MTSEKEDWAEAARMLNSIPLDSGQRNYEDAFKLDIYLKITQLQLEADDSVAAESSLNRATALVTQTSWVCHVSKSSSPLSSFLT